MAVATTERFVAEQPQTTGTSSKLFEPGGTTLEDSILRVWDDLVADGPADCPVCGGAMSAAGGCEGCGAELT
jgi:tRNA(Ile2) C34 agmatinyltransferase TiaS